MNKSKLIIGGIFMLALSLVIWSCKDNFTEEDQLKLQEQLQSKLDDKNSKDSIALSIQVYNASVTAGTAGGRVASTKGLAGIDVKLTYNGKTETKASDESGIVSFFVKPGSVSGTLSKTGFTTVNFTLDATRPVNTSDHLTNASVALPIFATSGATVSKVSGNVTYEADLLNNTRESVPDGKVKINFSPTQASLESYYSNSVNTVNADVNKYSIESALIASVTGGKFSIDLPTGAGDIGLIYNYQFSDFEADQKIAINYFDNAQYNSSVKRDATVIPAQFVSSPLPNNNFTLVPGLSALQIDIATPPASGSGASASVKLLPSSIEAGLGFSILAIGSGYPASRTDIPVTVTGGDFDNSVPGATQAVLFATSNANGQIININTTGGAGGTLGLGYRSRASLTIGGGGSGAVVRPDYAIAVAPLFGTGVFSGTSLSSGGSGYTVAPTVIVRGTNASGTAETQLTGTAIIEDGKVINLVLPGTPLSKVQPEVTFVPVMGAQAEANNGHFNASNQGALFVIGANTGLLFTGSGYPGNTPPSVTVRDIRGAGSGAVIIARMIVPFNGGLSSLTVANPGSGYSNSGSANFPASFVSFATTGISSGSQVRPGVSYTLNAYYGTGIKTQAVQ